jgi:glycosyltransferase involved in cell wall biosynthesis
MRIVHLTSYFVPKMGYSENYLPKEEKKLGNEVFIITSSVLISPSGYRVESRTEARMKSISFEDFFYDGVLVRRLPVLCSYGRFFLLKGIARSLIEFKPDIVFLEFANINSLFVLIFKTVLRYKIVATCGMPVNKLGQSALKRLAYEIFRNCIAPIFSKLVDVFVEATPENAERDSKELHINPHKIYFIPLGADTNLLKRDESKRKQTREILGIRENEIVYIYSGKLTKEKGIEMLINVFGRLMKSHKKAKLLIIGNGRRDFLNEIKQRVFNDGIDKSVIFHCFVPHDMLPSFYSAADVAIWPGSPSISIQEAISSGLPVIIRKSGHTIHLLEYSNGFSFNDLNVEELCALMEKLYVDSRLRKKMGMMSRKLAEDKLDWRVIAKKINDLYYTLLT